MSGCQPATREENHREACSLFYAEAQEWPVSSVCSVGENLVIEPYLIAGDLEKCFIAL